MIRPYADESLGYLGEVVQFNVGAPSTYVKILPNNPNRLALIVIASSGSRLSARGDDATSWYRASNQFIPQVLQRAIWGEVISGEIYFWDQSGGNDYIIAEIVDQKGVYQDLTRVEIVGP